MKNTQTLIEEFVASLWNKSRDTSRGYRGSLKRFSENVSANFEEITTKDIELFLINLKIWHKINTVNYHLAVIKSFFKWCTRRYDTKNIAQSIGCLKAPPPEQRILSELEYKKLIHRNTYPAREIIKFLANTGLRAAEFVNLKRENFSGGFIFVVGKGTKHRKIPINLAVKEVINEYPQLQFIMGKRTHWLWNVCRKAAKEARVEHFYPHSLRHYFATQLHKNGIPISTISKLLGHSSTATTERVYIHWSDDDLIGSTDCLAL